MKSICLSFLCAMSFTARGMDDRMHRELAKMDTVEKSKRERDHGFQGCVNQAACGFYGFYTAIYSPEGLCDNCEFKQFSDRFVGCLFCRTPHRKYDNAISAYTCSTCRNATRELLEKELATSASDRSQAESLEHGSFCAFEKVDWTIKRNYIAAFKKSAIREKIFGKGFAPFSGIYLGAMLAANGNKIHAWSKHITISPEDKKQVTWDSAPEHLKSIIGQYNIFGPETGEITLDHIPEGAITYEEELAKE